MSNENAIAVVYLQLEPVWSGWVGASGERRVRGVKATRLTQTRPARPLPGAVVVKLNLQVPTSAFRPLQPEAVVVIPEGMVSATPALTVTVGSE